MTTRNQTPRRRLLGLALICLCAVQLPALAKQSGPQTGAIRGSVFDVDYQSPLGEVRVSVVGTTLGARTTGDGSFLIQNVPVGSYTLTFSKSAYERTIQRNVVVVPGQMVSLRIDMSEEIYEMEELIVEGEDFLADTELGLLDIRAEAVTVQDNISSELIKKAGAGDVAGALNKVVGASVSEGKYATVRGLSDRYTGTTLHGVRIPSADPRRRAVPLDLFPTGTVESVNVTKTFTPDLQGDFTGGGVDIVTKTVPEDRVFSVSAKFESDSQATGEENFLSYSGGGVGLLNNGNRDLPGIALGTFPAFPSFSPNPSDENIQRAQEYDTLTRAFAPAMGVSTDKPGGNRGFSVAIGDQFDVGNGVLGVLAAVTEKRNFSFFEDASNNSGVVSDPTSGISQEFQTDSVGVEEILTGALVNVTLQPTVSDEITLRLVGNYAAEDSARILVEDVGGGTFEQNQSLRYVERTVASVQLQGKHDLFRTKRAGAWKTGTVDWSLASNSIEQDEPDVRFFRNIFSENDNGFRMPANSTDAQNTRRTWRNITEDDTQIQSNVAFPFVPSWTEREGNLRAGVYSQRSDREFLQNSFTYAFAQQVGNFFNGAFLCNSFAAFYQSEGGGILWTDVFTDEDRIGLAPEVPDCEFNPAGQQTPAANQLLWVIRPTGDDVNYSADQEIDAIYAMTDFPISAKFNAVVGARYETTSLNIVPRNDLFGTVERIEVQETSGDRALVTVPQEEGNASIDQGFVLPSVGLIYEVRPSMKLRATWSRTIARPTFRELAPVATEEFLQGDEFVGNPDLVLSEVTNYDLRWEWFRKSGELFAVSVFYKELTDPIEYISFSTNNRSFIQPVNFEKGRLEGAEFEARVDFGNYFKPLIGLTLGTNHTILDSESDVPIGEQLSLESFGLQEEKRRLQGQPESLSNAFITYDHDKSGTSVGLFYNRQGETLLTGAARGVEDGSPNVFQGARSTLDLTFRQKIGDRFSLSFSGKNLTESDSIRLYRLPNGDSAIRSLVPTGSKFSLSAGMSW